LDTVLEADVRLVDHAVDGALAGDVLFRDTKVDQEVAEHLDIGSQCDLAARGEESRWK
jgi:hypothetical protein